MKNILPLFALSVALLLSSCILDKIDNNEEATLEISDERSITAPNTNYKTSVEVITNQIWDAEVTSGSDWITVEKNGNTLKINIFANQTNQEREGFITITAANLTKRIIVYQEAGETIPEDPQPEQPYLNITPKNLNFTSNLGEEIITVSTNQETWTFETTADWLSLEQSNNSLIVRANANENTQAREAEIIISANTLRETVTIIQEGSTISMSVTPASLNVENTSGVYTINVESSSDWHIIIPQLDWVNVIPDKESNTIIFDVTSNPTNCIRVATIVINNESGDSINFTLTQKAGEDSESPDTFRIPNGNINFDIDKATLIEWEEANGGIYNTDESQENFISFHYTNHSESVIKRTYCLNTGGKGFFEGCEYYSNIEKFFTNENGIFEITESFNKILEIQGYESAGTTYGDFLVYTNKQLNVTILINHGQYSGLNDGNPIVEVRFYDINSFTSAVSL